MAALSDFLENKLIDWLLRGQSYTPPATIYVGLLKTASGDTGPGTEVNTGGYARVGVSAALANWAGTQSSGSTVASSGTSGTTSNNGTITFPTPTADWGQVVGYALFDAPSGGNMLIYAALDNPKTVNNGDPAPYFPAGALQFQIDN